MPRTTWHSRLLSVAAASIVVTAMIGTDAARADDPSVAQIQVRLVETRQHLNDLYAQSAAASEQLNGASVRLQEARATLTTQKKEQRRLGERVDDQRGKVAAIVVERMQSGDPTARAVSQFLDGTDPSTFLEQSSAISAADDAMTGMLSELDARRSVLAASTRRVEKTVKAQDDALGDQKSAQRQIDDSIKAAEAQATSIKAERDGLIRRLAAAKRQPVAEVRRRQDAIDQRLDRSGPSRPPTTTGSGGSGSGGNGSGGSGSGGGGHTSTPKAPAPKPTTPAPANPPPASGSKVDRAIAFAKAQLGEPYVWGGAGPSQWDCSGLTMRAWQAAGVNLPHYAGSQYAATRKVSVKSIQRGDLLYWSNGGPGSIYHVAMYLGNGQMIHAPRPGRGVEIVSIGYWIAPDLASRPG